MQVRVILCIPSSNTSFRHNNNQKRLRVTSMEFSATGRSASSERAGFPVYGDNGPPITVYRTVASFHPEFSHLAISVVELDNGVALLEAWTCRTKTGMIISSRRVDETC
eukprot:TRINITY_DN12653_c0_g3_i4.p1 TRINITY_DN12653_c0_g3~~TRINITY_DN12653_c0_g3_i4.p1  ORF type:complete len:109 (+),score=0.03 TRINITY_DN12653_c0_g3_i4:44-370(+)